MSAKTYSSRTADKFVVRLPDGMRSLIEEVARGNHRNMNSEIISRLEKSLEVDSYGEDAGLVLDLPPVTGWIPQESQLVVARGRSGVFILARFYFDEDDTKPRVMLVQNGAEFDASLDDIAPFVINR